MRTTNVLIIITFALKFVFFSPLPRSEVVCLSPSCSHLPLARALFTLPSLSLSPSWLLLPPSLSPTAFVFLRSLHSLSVSLSLSLSSFLYTSRYGSSFSPFLSSSPSSSSSSSVSLFLSCSLCLSFRATHARLPKASDNMRRSNLAS